MDAICNMNQTGPTPPEDTQPIKKARAKRVRTLRLMTRLIRAEFAEKFGVPASTLQKWEDGRSKGGLSEKGARRMVTALQKRGIYCTVEWLLHGVGKSPQFSELLYTNTTDTHAQDWDTGVKQWVIKEKEQETAMIDQEIQFFRQRHGNTLDLFMNDDSMLPDFRIGDYIAGIVHSLQKTEKLLGHICIVNTRDHGSLLRVLKKSSLPNRFTLQCTNPFTSLLKPTLYDIDVLSAAPITWVRRRHPDSRP